MSEGRAKRKMRMKTAQRTLRHALRLQDRGKKAYAAADALIAEIGQRSEARALIDIGTGTLYEVVDQFKDATLVWAHAAARRWQVRELSKRTSEALKAAVRMESI